MYLIDENDPASGEPCCHKCLPHAPAMCQVILQARASDAIIEAGRAQREADQQAPYICSQCGRHQPHDAARLYIGGTSVYEVPDERPEDAPLGPPRPMPQVGRNPPRAGCVDCYHEVLQSWQADEEVHQQQSQIAWDEQSRLVELLEIARRTYPTVKPEHDEDPPMYEPMPAIGGSPWDAPEPAVPEMPPIERAKQFMDDAARGIISLDDAYAHMQNMLRDGLIGVEVMDEAAQYLDQLQHVRQSADPNSMTY
jgi:hypothetical protein